MSVYLDEKEMQKNATNKAELEQWLIENNLQNAVSIFKEQNMTMEELLEYGEDENALTDYLKSLKLPQPLIHRICFKINKKLTTKNNNNQNNNNNNSNNKQKIIRIFVTDEEDKAMRELNICSIKIASLVNESQQECNNIMTTKQKLKSQINAKFNNLINVISNKQENVLKTLDELTKNIYRTTNSNLQHLVEQQKNVEKAIKQCNELLENIDIDKRERKQMVISTMNNIVKKVNKEIAMDNSPNDIVFTFNNHSITKFVSNLAMVYSEDVKQDEKEEKKENDDIMMNKTEFAHANIQFSLHQQIIEKTLNIINYFYGISKPQMYQLVKAAVSESLISIYQFLNVFRSTIPHDLLYQMGGKLLDCVCGQIVNSVTERVYFPQVQNSDISVDSAHNISLLISHIKTFYINNKSLKNDMKFLVKNATIWNKFIKLGAILDKDQSFYTLNQQLNEGELTIFDNETLIKIVCAVFQKSDMRTNFIKLIKEKNNMKDKIFVYVNDYDKNGICYALATNFNKTKWINPARKKLISLKSSGWNEQSESIDYMVSRTSVNTSTLPKENAWIRFDFGGNIKISPTAYTLRHSKDKNACYLRNWNLMGSIDGVYWKKIMQHGSTLFSDKSLYKPGQSCTWIIKNCYEYYRFFKIEMTAKNSSWSWLICVNGFEIYGYLKMKK
eukprot:400984_1